jgi:hypothetical protein
MPGQPWKKGNKETVLNPFFPTIVQGKKNAPTDKKNSAERLSV